MRPAPDAVRRVLLRWAADALGALPADQVPSGLRQIARFRAGRRASLGGAALSAALESDAVFRAGVAEHARGLGIDVEGDGDLPSRAAAALLWQHPDADSLLDQAASVDEVAELRRRVRELEAERDSRRDASRSAEALAGVLPEALPLAAAIEGPTEDPVVVDLRSQVDRLRQRLRDQGVQLREARDAVAGAVEEARTELRDLRVAHDRAQAELRQLSERLTAETARADRASEQLELARAADRTATESAHRRVELLLETVEQASAGLRQEWQLVTGGPDPAQRVADRLARPQPRVAGDQSNLASWLALPHAHLIVDGYNVTKTAYPDLTLAEQRERLIRELGQLTVRPGAEPPEITVVFDGAAVPVAAPPRTRQGVRVMFSPPGVIADDVIRELVAAEPAGRVVVVVSADREVVATVERRGARAVSPSVMIAGLRWDERARR